MDKNQPKAKMKTNEKIVIQSLLWAKVNHHKNVAIERMNSSKSIHSIEFRTYFKFDEFVHADAGIHHCY